MKGYTSCELCGRQRDLHVHHVEPKRMGGRHGGEKARIERSENKRTLCAVCHGAAHGIRTILPDGWNCDLCPSNWRCPIRQCSPEIESQLPDSDELVTE